MRSCCCHLRSEVPPGKQLLDHDEQGRETDNEDDEGKVIGEKSQLHVYASDCHHMNERLASVCNEEANEDDHEEGWCRGDGRTQPQAR